MIKRKKRKQESRQNKGLFKANENKLKMKLKNNPCNILQINSSIGLIMNRKSLFQIYELIKIRKFQVLEGIFI